MLRLSGLKRDSGNADANLLWQASRGSKTETELREALLKEKVKNMRRLSNGGSGAKADANRE
jgi:hypothetical protein